MKLPDFFKKDNTVQNNAIATRGGSYSLVVTAIVLAIVIAANLFVSLLPSRWTTYDISAAKLYSITSNTKVVVNALQKDVTIYWICQADAEDRTVENLLDKYENLSDHITVVKKNPDVYPTFAAQYTDETVANNSLIVECGNKYRYIGYDDIYLQDIDYTTYSYSSSFDGEGAITSAIDYVISDDLPQIYLLEGHGELDLPAEFSDQIEKENMELVSFSLLNEDEIPAEADCVMIYAPQSDFSEEEAAILNDYVAGGGKLLVFSGPVEEASLTNLDSILSHYGVEAAEGIVVESDRNYYAFQSPYILLPEIQSSAITDSLMEANYYAIVPLAQGFTVADSDIVTALLTTSDTAYSKAAGYAMETYDQEEDDTDGPFALAVSVETTGGGQMVWVGSSAFLDEMYNAYSSGANLDMAMNALSTLIGESEAVAIRSKSLDYNYLTISESASAVLKAVMIGVLPAAFIVCGIVVVAKRRSVKHAQV